MQIPITLLGHKDHGKSTLIGRLLLDSNSVKEDKIVEVRAIDEAMGKPFELAHILDSFREERQDEMTMDTTVAYLKGKKRIYELIDVPGHQELIQNMLTGASNARLAILVIWAEEGIGRQTLQHLSLASLLGIKNLLVAVNKMDEIGYSKEVFGRVKKKVESAVKKNGFVSVSYVPVSASQGDNAVKRSGKMSWYRGKTIFEHLENFGYQDDRLRQPLRVPIQDVYEDGKGCLVVGRVESGVLKSGERVCIFPADLKAKVDKILVGMGQVKKASFGQNVGIVLEKADLKIERGMVIAGVGNSPATLRKVRLQVVMIKRPKRERLLLECGTQERVIPARPFLRKPIGQKALAVVDLELPLVVDVTFDSPLKRCVLKERGSIVGAGIVL